MSVVIPLRLKKGFNSVCTCGLVMEIVFKRGDDPDNEQWIYAVNFPFKGIIDNNIERGGGLLHCQSSIKGRQVWIGYFHYASIVFH